MALQDIAPVSRKPYKPFLPSREQEDFHDPDHLYYPHLSLVPQNQRISEREENIVSRKKCRFQYQGPAGDDQEIKAKGSSGVRYQWENHCRV